jgi:hypothetical protein
MVQPWCVHVAVSAIKESWPVWATSSPPLLYCTNAALPTAANGDEESMLSVMVLPETAAWIVGNAGASAETESSLHALSSGASVAPSAIKAPASHA